jgi:hypothetical protein
MSPSEDGNEPSDFVTVDEILNFEHSVKIKVSFLFVLSVTAAAEKRKGTHYILRSRV